MEEIGSAIRELQIEAQRAKRLAAGLGEKLISRSDDHQVVTATVSGTGHLHDLRLTDAALAHPARLGSLITVAIKRARNASARLREGAREKYLPNMGSNPSVEAAFSSELEATGFEMEEIDGSWREYDEIAQSIEAYNKFVRANKLFKEQRLQQEVGTGSGVVVIGVDGTLQSVTIQSEAPRQVGLHRLSKQIIEAVSRAEATAVRMRQERLKEITINGVSIGENNR